MLTSIAHNSRGRRFLAATLVLLLGFLLAAPLVTLAGDRPVCTCPTHDHAEESEPYHGPTFLSCDDDAHQGGAKARLSASPEHQRIDAAPMRMPLYVERIPASLANPPDPEPPRAG